MGMGRERGFMLVPEAWLMSSVSAPFMVLHTRHLHSRHVLGLAGDSHAGRC